MNKSIIAGILLLLVMGIVIACNQKEFSHTPNLNKNLNKELKEDLKEGLYENLNIHLSKPDGDNYTVYRKIEDHETVKTVMEILLNVSWENAKVSMSRMPDNKIEPINLFRNISYEPLTYAIWISPKKNILEVIIEGQSKYGKISEEDSTLLLTILETPQL